MAYTIKSNRHTPSNRYDSLKSDVVKFLLSKGWVKDRWGNYKKKIKSQTGKVEDYRMKICQNVLRYEVMSSTGPYWIRLKSGYWRDIKVSEEKGIIGLRWSI